MSLLLYSLLFLVVLLLLAVWVWCVVQIVARPDIRVWAKALWIVGILVFPVIGAVAYIIFAARRGPVDATQEWAGKSAEEIRAEEYRAGHMTSTDRAGNQPWL